MASTFKPSYCIEGDLPEVTEGQFYVTTDTKKIYADLQGVRIDTGDFITVDNEASLPLVSVKGKLYIALAERTLWIYSAGWIQIDKPNVATTTKAGVVKVDGSSIKITEDGTISTAISDLLNEAQLSAINSGVTATKLSGYDSDITSLKENGLYYEIVS